MEENRPWRDSVQGVLRPGAEGGGVHVCELHACLSECVSRGERDRAEEGGRGGPTRRIEGVNLS